MKRYSIILLLANQFQPLCCTFNVKREFIKIEIDLPKVCQNEINSSFKYL